MGHVRITKNSNFVDGIAYPSLHYGYDFGDETEGLHNTDRIKEAQKDFAELARNGIHAVRMNVFTDGRAGIKFDSTGRPIGYDQSVVEGLQNVLATAAVNNMHLDLVMLDHTFAEKLVPIDATHSKQGHGEIFASQTMRQELLQNVLVPLLKEIGQDPNISNLMAVELVNEPESFVQTKSQLSGRATNPYSDMTHPIPDSDLAGFKQLMRSFRDAVHSETGAQFTVGSLSIEFADIWLDVLDPARDFLSPHYYAQNGEAAYRKLYGFFGRLRKLGRDLPIVWGEYAANGSLDFSNPGIPQSFVNARQFLDDALKGGRVRGAFGWAYRDGNGKLGDIFGQVPLEQHRQFTLDNLRKVEFGGGYHLSDFRGLSRA